MSYYLFLAIIFCILACRFAYVRYAYNYWDKELSRYKDKLHDQKLGYRSIDDKIIDMFDLFKWRLSDFIDNVSKLKIKICEENERKR